MSKNARAWAPAISFGFCEPRLAKLLSDIGAGGRRPTELLPIPAPSHIQIRLPQYKQTNLSPPQRALCNISFDPAGSGARGALPRKNKGAENRGSL